MPLPWENQVGFQNILFDIDFTMKKINFQAERKNEDERNIIRE